MGWHVHEMGTVAWIYLILLFLLFVVSGIYLTKQKKDPPEEMDDEPVNILNKRFARGEITRQEYEEMKKILLEK